MTNKETYRKLQDAVSAEVDAIGKATLAGERGMEAEARWRKARMHRDRFLDGLDYSQKCELFGTHHYGDILLNLDVSWEIRS